MRSTFNKLEKIIVTLSICCFLLVLLIQGLNLGKNNIYSSSAIDNGYDVFSPFQVENNEEGVVVFKNIHSEYKKVEILLNGNSVGNFLKSDEIEVVVCDGDMIEINGSKYKDTLDIKIVGISSNIKFPKLGSTLTTSQSIEILGEVRLK